MKVAFTKPPDPLTHPPDLRKLMLACGVENFHGAIDTVYRCPCCWGIARNPNPPTFQQYRTRYDTLRVMPTPENDWAFHCHNCGFLGNGLHLLRNSRDGRLGTWENSVAKLYESDVFNGKEPDVEWIERARAWTELQWVYSKAVANAQIPWMNEPGSFGEYGVIGRVELGRRFPPAGPLSTSRESRVRVRLVRTIQGLPSYLQVLRYEHNVEICRCYFHHPGSLEVFVPAWAKYYDWRQELAIATDIDTAVRFQGDLREKNAEPIPILYVIHCGGEMVEEVPTRLIHYLAGQEESGEFSLALSHLRSEVRVRRISEVIPGTGHEYRRLAQNGRDPIQFVCDAVIQRTASDVQALAYLDAILAKPWITATTRNAVTAAVAARLKLPLDTAISMAGTLPRLHPFVGEHATFLCRNGIYVKSSDRARNEFRPCSNFSLQIRESYLEDTKALNHRFDFVMGTHRTSITLSEAEYLDGKKLMEATTAAACREGWDTLPNVNAHGVLALLPHIVRGTQPAPLGTYQAPAVWGYNVGEFQGPDYSIRPEGLRLHPLRSEFPNVVQMLPPIGESPGVHLGWDILRQEARTFASWFSVANSLPRDLVLDLFYAGLYWLHRGSRGLQSFLALQTRAHFDSFERLMGIQSIQVGRGPREHLGVPRLMASSYWSVEHFQRQGRIVAAIEDKAHRLDSKIICMTHGLVGGRNPKFPDLDELPESIFLLLAYAVIGQPTMKACFDRLIALVEEKELKDQFRFISYHGSSSLVAPGLYLEKFLSALQFSGCLKQFAISDHKQKGAVLERRSVMERLHGAGKMFDIYRVAEEVKTVRRDWKLLGTYSRKKIPVIRIPDVLLDEAIE